MPMTETEPGVPHPLFGKFCSYDELQPSNSSAESLLILASIEVLDKNLNSVESLQTACRFLSGIRYRSIGFVRKHKSILEKLLLWCFYIRKIPLLHLTDLDLVDFELFYLSPPKHWVANRSCCRFNATANSTCFNKSWRPFHPPHNLYDSRRLLCRTLNRVIRDILPNVTMRAILAYKQPSTDTKDLTSGEIQVIIESYLNYLFELRSNRSAHARKLFVFVCAVYLKVDVRAFNVLRPHLYLNAVTRLSDGGFSWKIDTPDRQVIHYLPESFGRYYERYCDAVGFNTETSYPPNELAFQCTAIGCEVTAQTVISWLQHLPKHPQIDFTPSKLLDAIAKKSANKAERINYSAIKRMQDVIIDSKKRYHKFQVRLDGMHINSSGFEESQLLLNSGGVVFPLLCLTVTNGAVALCFNYSEVRQAFNLIDNSLICGHINSIRTLLLYTNSQLASGKLKKPTTAYEILVLWTLLVYRKPVCMLNEADVVKFFEFCCEPPASWVTINTRRVLRGCDPRSPYYDSRWRPFRASRGRPRARAAMIITHCSQMQAWAIKCGLQDLNVFLKLKGTLWNGRE